MKINRKPDPAENTARSCSAKLRAAQISNKSKFCFNFAQISNKFKFCIFPIEFSYFHFCICFFVFSISYLVFPAGCRLQTLEFFVFPIANWTVFFSEFPKFEFKFSFFVFYLVFFCMFYFVVFSCHLTALQVHLSLTDSLRTSHC